MNTMKFWFYLGWIVLFAMGCNNTQNADKNDGKKVVIISKMNSKRLYSKWLQHHDSTLFLVNAFVTPSDSLQMFLAQCSGILLTGGEDISPDRYGKANEAPRCEVSDLFRDSLEIALIQYAMQNNVPILGICRGHQLLTVANGGSLIIDIPTDVGSDSLHRNRDEQTEHYVYLTKGSRLYEICGVDSALIVSHHHQAAERVPAMFRTVAFASDSIIEAIEPVDGQKYNFLIGVQWHPERMDYNNPLSGNLATHFLKAISDFKRL